VSKPEAQSPEGSGPKPGFYVLMTDGGITYEQGRASGQAAIGVVLKDSKYRDVDEISKAIGWARNHHVAEYEALIEGLKLARRHGIDRIRVFLDSALVVNTVNGDWQLRPKDIEDLNDLKDLCARACVLVKEFAYFKMCWVPRGMNVEADALASRALGRGGPLGAPRVIGQTKEAEARKARRTARGTSRWDIESIVAELESNRSSAEAHVARELHDWVLERGWRPTFRKGAVEGSFIPVLEPRGTEHSPFAVYSSGRVEIQFLWLTRPPSTMTTPNVNSCVA
jgi:ribonuclease HI